MTLEQLVPLLDKNKITIVTFGLRSKQTDASLSKTKILSGYNETLKDFMRGAQYGKYKDKEVAAYRLDNENKQWLRFIKYADFNIDLEE